MSAQIEKIALFIDGANLYATAKSLGFDIDYKRLLREFQSRGYLVRAFYYTAVIEDQEYSSIRPLIDWLDYNGYTVVTKATKEFVDQTGRRKVKGNMDIELAVDAMELAPHIDQMVLFSGDGDFRSLVEAVQRRGVRVIVVSTISTQPPMVADELRRQADEFVDIIDPAKQDRPRSGRTPGARAAGGPRAAPHAAIPPAQHRRPARRSRRSKKTSSTKNKRSRWPQMARPSGKPGRDCPRCPRLVAFRNAWRERGTGLVQCAGAFVRADRRTAPDRRAGSGPARRQPHRTAVHRRLCRRSSLRHAQGLRLRARKLRGASRRRASRLVDCRITNAVRCVPPENKPTPLEIKTCRDFLAATIEEMTKLSAIVALGRVAHETLVTVRSARRRDHVFSPRRRARRWAASPSSTATTAPATTPTRACLRRRCSAMFSRRCASI